MRARLGSVLRGSTRPLMLLSSTLLCRISSKPAEMWINIEFKIDHEKKQLISPWVVVLIGEGAKEKALLLDGSEVGGRKLTVSPVDQPTDGLSTSVRAARYVADFQKERSEAISVTGYDPSLPQDDVKSALRKHFASCGEITDIEVLDSRALVHLYGLGSVHRAVQLNGTDLGGGFKFTVQALSEA